MWPPRASPALHARSQSVRLPRSHAGVWHREPPCPRSNPQVRSHQPSGLVQRVLCTPRPIQAEPRPTLPLGRAVHRTLFINWPVRGLVTDAIHESGKGALYVRPIDLRVGTPDQPGLEVIVDDVLRTGPLVHADARVVATGDRVQIEIPHLHRDTPSFVPGARFHLRLLQFSVYPAASKPGPGPATGHDAIGVAATRQRSEDRLRDSAR